MAASSEFSIVPVGCDDWARVRHVHTTAFQLFGNSLLGDSERNAFVAYARSPEYAGQLLEEHLHAAWFEGQLVGTAGWMPADDNGALVRISSVFVQPLFARLGIGTKLVHDAEARARAAGFERLTVCATLNSVSFFEKLGYEITAHGVHALTSEQGMHVIYMRKRPFATHVARQPGTPRTIEAAVAAAEPS